MGWGDFVSSLSDFDLGDIADTVTESISEAGESVGSWANEWLTSPTTPGTTGGGIPGLQGGQGYEEWLLSPTSPSSSSPWYEGLWSGEGIDGKGGGGFLGDIGGAAVGGVIAGLPTIGGAILNNQNADDNRDYLADSQALSFEHALELADVNNAAAKERAEISAGAQIKSVRARLQAEALADRMRGMADAKKTKVGASASKQQGIQNAIDTLVGNTKR